MKKPILFIRIFSNWRLKAFTEHALTISCVKLFHRFRTREEKKWSLVSVRQWTFINFQVWPRIQLSVTYWKTRAQQ